MEGPGDAESSATVSPRERPPEPTGPWWRADRIALSRLPRPWNSPLATSALLILGCGIAPTFAVLAVFATVSPEYRGGYGAGLAISGFVLLVLAVTELVRGPRWMRKAIPAAASDTAALSTAGQEPRGDGEKAVPRLSKADRFEVGILGGAAVAVLVILYLSTGPEVPVLVLMRRTCTICVVNLAVGAIVFMGIWRYFSLYLPD